jgi:hypothetical protein
MTQATRLDCTTPSRHATRTPGGHTLRSHHRGRLGLPCASRMAGALHGLELRWQLKPVKRWWPADLPRKACANPQGHAEPPLSMSPQTTATAPSVRSPDHGHRYGCTATSARCRAVAVGVGQTAQPVMPCARSPGQGTPVPSPRLPPAWTVGGDTVQAGRRDHRTEAQRRPCGRLATATGAGESSAGHSTVGSPRP